jgi:cytosine/adenosine deaminase-related metal-dependent hydrolase
VILFRNVFHLATMNDAGDRLEGVDVLVDGPRIARIGENLAVPSDSPPLGRGWSSGGASDLRVIDCSHMLMLPGFVNLHHHFYQTLQRNIPSAQNQKLFDWLVTLYEVWAGLDAAAIRASTRVACAELLLTGCTMTSDQMYVFPDGVREDLIGVEIEAARELGIRFHPTRGSMSRGKSQGGLPPDSVVQREEDILADSVRLIDRFHDKDPFAMTRIALAPCSPFSATDRLMAETAALAREKHVLLHTHLAETEDETAYCIEHYGMRPLAAMEKLGWVGEDVWFAHGIHFEDDELGRLAETGTGIAHCPTSNMRLSSGVAPIPAMIGRGVRVGLAVDGSASNDTSDMLGELRNCLLVHLLAEGPEAITAEQVVRLATRGGADILGRPETGSIEEGKAADIVLIDMSRLGHAGALSDPLAAIVYTGYDHTVDCTVVNGEIVVERGALVRANEAEIAGEANDISARMLEAAGIDARRPR